MLANTLVLNFHGIGDPAVPQAPGEDRYFVTEDIYRRTIRALAKQEADSHAKICITFDDGNLSDLAVGLPALAEVGRSALFFVLAGRIGQKGYLSGQDIRELVAAGMSIGNHGWDHVDWTQLDEAGRQRELYDARMRIADAAGVPIDEAAIPFGHLDRALLGHLKDADYSRVNTSSRGLAMDGAWFRPRCSVTSDFDPDRDIAQQFKLRKLVRGTLSAPLRRLRFGI
ncbi:polysaccharide deacetylase family protein [Oricola indica]|uniref:polysaccharide deacetylase family protein n=1 Tax=Oricola indica TaxID=2872591 RepID=UPI003CCBDD0E